MRGELVEVFGSGQLTPLQHHNQRNETWLLETGDGCAVVKRYRLLTSGAITGVLRAEHRARQAGIPVPEVLHRCEDRRFVVYAHVEGIHRIPRDPRHVDQCAASFARQLRALTDFVPVRPPARPDGLPQRAVDAVRACRDAQLSGLIADAWTRLDGLASRSPISASHVDWRADNVLFNDDDLSAVLDWESVLLLPAAEAVGYAAGSFTHSWRPELRHPIDPVEVLRFLDAVSLHPAWSPRASELEHARAAALYTSAVRLAEDQRAGAAAVSGRELRSSLEW